MNRRFFLKSSAFTGGLFYFTKPLLSQKPVEPISLWKLQINVKNPVIIRSVEVLEFEKELFLVATSTDGIQGITLCNSRMPYLVPMLKELVIPFFLNKDARDLSKWVDEVYREERNYKHVGMPFWNCVGHLEIALWDLLGKSAQKPVNELLGNDLLNEIPVYLSSLTRKTSPEQEVENFKKKLEETGANAIKFKVGGRMSPTEEVPDRTKNLLPLLRKTLGDRLKLYADANGSFDVKEGIEMGKMLEDFGVDILEEPCPWEDYEANRKVKEAMKKIKVAGGEQDTSLYRFKDILQQKVYDIVQPDLFYNGGLIRSLKVAEMAKESGKFIAPHSPKADPLAAPLLHFASVVTNLYGYQEYPASFNVQKMPGWYSPHLIVKDGWLKVPIGEGLGIQYDEAIWKKARKL